MSLPPLEILGPLRVAALTHTDFIALLATYAGVPAIFTARPTPSEAVYPMAVFGPLVTRSGDEDGINDHRPVLTVDCHVYGDNPAHYQVVEDAAELLFSFFHRQRNISVSGYTVTDIRCSGPAPAATDDDSKVGRRVTLTIRLRAAFL